MTLVDVMAMVVGVAVGLTVVENQDVYSMTGYLAMLPDRVEVLAERLVGWIWVGSLTMGVVSLGRVVRHRRRPREAEWLVMILAIAYAFGSERIWLPADWLNYRLWHSPENSVDWFGERWAVATLTGLIALGFLGILRLLRRRLPPWATTVGLCLAMTLIFWGPIHVITLEGASFLVRTQGKVQNFFAWSVADWFVSVPLGLCLGIPIVGAIADLARPRERTWVDWGSLVASAAVFLVIVAGWSPQNDPGSWVWFAEFMMAMVWAGLILGSSWLVHARIGPIGRFWYVSAQPEHSTPSVTSPPSTA